jgi:hypothetical protein
MSYIPKSITYVYSKKKGKNGIYPVFVVDTDNSKTMETAEYWAGKPISYEQCSNDIITNPVIQEIEYRGEGGRAYKTIINGKYLIDFREDQLIYVLLNEGINKGIMKGKFQFGIMGSQMKLLAIGSPEYEEAVKGSNLKEMKKITEFKVGHRYETAGGSVAIYLGSAYIPDIRVEREYDNCFGSSRKHYIKVTKSSQRGKMQIWYEVPRWLDKREQSKEITDFRTWSISVKKTFAAVIDKGLAKNIPTIEEIKKKSQWEMENPDDSTRRCFNDLPLRMKAYRSQDLSLMLMDADKKPDIGEYPEGKVLQTW